MEIKKSLLTLFLINVILFTSCKDSDKEALTDGNVIVSIAGIENPSFKTSNLKKTSTRINQSENTLEIFSFNGFDAITTVHLSNYENINKIANLQSNKLASTIQKLADTVQYRLILFKENDSNPFINTVILSGTPQKILLPVGENFKWVIYSTNKSTVPQFTDHVLTKSDLSNQDFLYNSGMLTVETGINKIDAPLKRLTTQYEVNLDVRGMFSSIHEDTKVTLLKSGSSLLKTADFNIFTGEVVQGTMEAYSVENSSLLSENNINDQKKVTFYTFDHSIPTANSLKLKVSPLKLIMDDNSIRTFDEVTVNLKHDALDQGGLNTMGRKFTVSSQLVESGIQVGTSSTVWARANLFYDATNLTGKYRFRPSPHYRDMDNKNPRLNNYLGDPNDLWRFNTTTPNGQTQQAGYDPCTDVYPNGLWKMPSSADFSALPNQPNQLAIVDRNEPLIIGLLGLIGNTKPYETVAIWNKNGVSNSNPIYDIPYRTNDPLTTMNNLVFSGVGYNNVLGDITERPVWTSLLSVVGIVNVAPVVTGGGFYWTSDNLSSTSAVEEPKYFKFTSSGAKLASVILGDLLRLQIIDFNGYSQSTSSNTLIGSVSLPTKKDNWKNRLNIRCVRNPNFGK